MATKQKEKEEDVTEAPPPAPAAGKRRASGTLAAPVYLIHRGKFEVEVPAVISETIENDEDSANYGNVVTEELEAAQKISGVLPKGSRFGTRRIGVAHEITDAAEAEALKARGFEPATKAEVAKSAAMGGGKTVDDIAASDRLLAQQKLRRMIGGVRTVADE